MASKLYDHFHASLFIFTLCSFYEIVAFEAHEEEKEEVTGSPANAKETSVLQQCAAIQLKWEMTTTKRII